MFKNRFAVLLFVFCLPALAACSTMKDGSTQQVMFKTTGADGAKCDIMLGQNRFRYSIYPPQTAWVQKTREPLFVSCRANGNRVANKTVESTVAGSTFLNILNLGIGGLYDAESGASYRYPDEIVIDFSDSTPQDQPLPGYHGAGSLVPSEQGIEYMGPDTTALSQDKILSERYRSAYEESARLEAEEAANNLERQRRIDSVEGGFNGDKTMPKESVTPETAPVSPLPEKSPQLGKPLFNSSTSF